MTEIMRKESNLNTMEGRNFTELIPEFLIAIDHGWSSIKTPNIIFENGITELQTMPAKRITCLSFEAENMLLVRAEWVSRRPRQRMNIIIF